MFGPALTRRGRGSWSIATYLGGLVGLFALAGATGVIYALGAANHNARVDALADAKFGALQATAAVHDGIGELQTAAAQLAATPGLSAAFGHSGCTLSFDGSGPFTSGHLDVLRPDGTVACTSQPRSVPVSYAKSDWFTPAPAAPVLVGPVIDASTSKLTMAAVAPIAGGGFVAGFVNLDALGAGLASQFGGPRHLEFLVATADGARSLSRSLDPARWVDASLAGTPFARSGGTGVQRRDVNGTWRLYGTATVSGLGWRVYAGADRGVALAQADRLFRAALAIIVGSLLVVLVAAYVVWRRVATPIRRLSTAVRVRAAEGAAPAISVSGPAEVETLAAELTGLVRAVERELAERHRAEEMAVASERNYRLLFFDNPEAMWVYDPETLRFVAVNDAAVARYGYSREEFLAMTVAQIRPPEDVAAVMASIANAATLDRSGPWRHLKKDRSIMQVEITSHALTFEGRPARFVMAEDVTERQAYETQLRHLALDDPVTGLPNRTVIVDRLERALIQAERLDQLVAVVRLNLDRFNVIDAAHGKEAADLLLCEVAARLTEMISPGDTLGRLDAAEFAIVCENLPGETAAIVTAERIEGAMSAPFTLGDDQIVLSASVGIVLSRGLQLPAELLRDAAATMHRARELGGGRYELFDEGIRTRTLAKLETESALRRAVEHDELRLYYQPEIDLASGSCPGAEALMRWQHPTRGLLQPIEFIPLAEEAGLISSLGRWALQEACRQAAAWQQTDVGALSVSVNLSAHQLTQPDLTAQVTEALDQSGLDPALLSLELTESALMQDVDETLSILSSLRDLGVTLSIDDFGTGYSSLLYLRRYPVSYIKIDRAFVAGLDHSSEDEAIVSGVVGLGHAFGLKVVAEGVETASQAKRLRLLGCDLGQGYLWSPAIPPADMHAALASLRTPSSDNRP